MYTSNSSRNNIHIYIKSYIYTCICVCIYIYIYIERERERNLAREIWQLDLASLPALGPWRRRRGSNNNNNYYYVSNINHNDNRYNNDSNSNSNNNNTVRLTTELFNEHSADKASHVGCKSSSFETPNEPLDAHSSSAADMLNLTSAFSPRRGTSIVRLIITWIPIASSSPAH